MLIELSHIISTQKFIVYALLGETCVVKKLDVGDQKYK